MRQHGLPGRQRYDGAWRMFSDRSGAGAPDARAGVTKTGFSGVGLCGAAASLAVLLGLALPAGPVAAQNIIAYPERGQNQEQQQRDRFDCYDWAQQQTGFNPRAAQYGSSMPPPEPEGGVMRGGMGGAALGAIGGAIGGNAGKGAAIGAVVGGLFGGFRRREAEMQQAQYEQQREASYSHRDATFNRAMSACLRGRGYSVD
jgi:hypothetical protein